MKKLIRHSGFTLVELLVVISIIGILATLLVTSFTSANKQARDARRKSDINQYQNALEVYANRHGGLYPLRSSLTPAATTLCEDLTLTSCPDDPRSEETGASYQYISLGSGSEGGASATDYVIYAALEGTNSTYWVACSNGKTNTLSATVSVNSGVCPL